MTVHFCWKVFYQCKPGSRKDFYQALSDQEIRKKTLREAGCIKYDFFLDTQEPDVLLLTEAWDDLESQSAHHLTDACRQLQAIKAEYCIGTTIDKFNF